MSTSDNSESKHSKVFVGGISIHTTDENFKYVFSEYGEIIDSIILRDPETNRSRGFGFVTFSDSQSVQQVLDSRPINIDGRDVDVKRAIPKESNNPQAHSKTEKVFIGGLPNDITKEELTEYFESYGPILEVELIYKEGVFKGYGFITFKDCDTADKVIVDGEFSLRENSKMCRVSKAGSRGGRQQSGGYQQMGPYSGPGYGAYQGAQWGGTEFNGYQGAKGGYFGPGSGYAAPSGAYSGYAPAYGGYGGSYAPTGAPSGSYDTKGYSQPQQTAYGAPASNFGASGGSEYMYGYGHSSGGSGYSGGGGPHQTGARGGSSRGGRSRYKPY